MTTDHTHRPNLRLVQEGGPDAQIQVRKAPRSTSVLPREDEPRYGTQAWADWARREAHQEVRNIKRSFIRLGEFIYKLNVHEGFDPARPKLYEAWGYDSVEEFCEAELNINGRKAKYLCAIYYKLYVYPPMAALPLEVREELLKVRYSSLRNLIGVLQPWSALEWARLGQTYGYEAFNQVMLSYRRRVERAREEGVDVKQVPLLEPERQQALETAQESAASLQGDPIPTGSRLPSRGGDSGAGPSSQDKPDPFVFIDTTRKAPRPHKHYLHLSDSEEKVFQQALKGAQGVSGTSSVSANVALIALDFQARHGAADPETGHLSRYLSSVERSLGIQLVAIDPSKGGAREAILHGGDHLNTFARLVRENPEERSEE